MGNINLQKAEDFFMKSLRIRYHHFGENHSDVASSLDNLGTLYKYMGDKMKAEDFFLKSLRIRQTLFDENHFEVANSLNNLGLFYSNGGKISKTKAFYLKSLNIRQNLFKDCHLCGKINEQFRNVISKTWKSQER